MRVLWFAFTSLVSVFAGVAGGVLGYLAGDQVAKAVLGGGAAFAATMTLGVLIMAFLQGRRA